MNFNAKGLKRNKSRLMLAMCVIMTMGLTAACSGGNAGSNEPSAKPQETGGASNDSGKGSEPEPLTLTWMRYEHPNQALPEDATIIKEIARITNVTISLQSVPQSNYEDKKKTLIATNNAPDIMLVKQDDLSNFADSGIFLDLTPYLDRMPNFSKVLEEKPEINKNKIDGKLYGFPLVQKLAASQSGQVPVIRVDLLEKHNLEVPTTYEELYEVLKALKSEYPSSYPFASRAANGLSGTENLINPIAFGFGSGYTNVNGAKVYYDPHAGEYRFGPFSEAFKEAIAYLRKLYENNLLDPDYTTATSQIWQEKLSSGQSFYYQDNTGFGVNFNKALQEKDPDAGFDLLPMLEGGDGNGVKRGELYQLDHLSESYAISADVKNPERVVEFMDWLYSEEGVKLTSWGIESEHYTMENGEFKINDSFFSKFLDAPNPYLAKDSELGTGYLGLSLHNDATYDLNSQPELMQEWTRQNIQAVEDGLAFRMPYDPSFTQEEREELKKLRTKLDAYLTQTMDKFIMTKNGLDEWDSFLEQCRSNGAERIVEIYNTALARAK